MTPSSSLIYKILSGAYGVLMYIFIFLPVVVLVLFSFHDGKVPVPPFEGPTIEWYKAVLSKDRLVDATINSVLVAVASALVSTILGFLAAYGLSRHEVRGASILQWLLMAPLTVSYLIVGMGLLIVFNATGIGKSLISVSIGHVVINLPIAFAICLSQLGEHQASLERAARDLGASGLKVIALITVPLIWPGIMASLFLCFTLSWDEFVIAFLLSRFDITLPVEIWSMLRTGLSPETNAAGTLVFLTSFIMVIGFELTRFRRDSQK